MVMDRTVKQEIIKTETHAVTWGNYIHYHPEYKNYREEEIKSETEKDIKGRMKGIMKRILQIRKD